MSENNRICKVCGNKYYYCPTCGNRKPGWYLTYDSEACKNLFQMAVEYNLGNIDDKEALEIIEKNAVEKIENDGVKEVVDKVKTNSTLKKIKKVTDIVSEF